MKPRRGAKPPAKPEIAPKDHLGALGALVDHAFPEPTKFFDHGLALLVQQLGVERAVMSRFSALGWETFWWATAENVKSDEAVFAPIHHFCPHVLQHPDRVLTIRDAQAEVSWKGHSAVQRLGIRSYMGTPLHQDGEIIGVLSVTSAQPKNFSRAEIAMLKAMANLFSRTIEVEHLKHELRLTRDALDLTNAVVEDSALETHMTRLPNRHYLDIWLRANLYLARRRGEAMSLIRWHLGLSKESSRHLQEIADRLRGEDLLVDLSREEFLLLLPRTPQEGAQILIGRIRAKLGPIPMGASLWNPLHHKDAEDMRVEGAMARAESALKASMEKGGAVEWIVLELQKEDHREPTPRW